MGPSIINANEKMRCSITKYFNQYQQNLQELLFLPPRQAWKLGPALATGNVVVMKVKNLGSNQRDCSAHIERSHMIELCYLNRFLVFHSTYKNIVCCYDTGSGKKTSFLLKFVNYGQKSFRVG